MALTTLFVYGTLKSGMSHNHRMAGQELIGSFRTLPRYRLYACGWHPGLVETAEGGVAVEGELWRVDDQALAELDRFEGRPNQRSIECDHENLPRRFLASQTRVRC